MLNQQLVDFLKDCGVCQICQLRYLKARGNEYKDLKESFDKVSPTKLPYYKLVKKTLINLIHCS